MPLPPAYKQVLIPISEEEIRGKKKTKGGPPPIVNTPVRKYGGGPKKGVRRSENWDVVVKSAVRPREPQLVLVSERV